jgi:hypothetical protein
MGASKKKARREAKKAQLNLGATPQKRPNSLDSGNAKPDCIDKMAEIILDFAESLRGSLDDEDAVLTLAMGAWNIAIFPKKDHRAKIDELVAYCLPNGDSRVMEKINAVVGMLVSRKLDLYRDNKIVLHGYEFIDLGDKMALSIISSVSRQR